MPLPSILTLIQWCSGSPQVEVVMSAAMTLASQPLAAVMAALAAAAAWASFLVKSRLQVSAHWLGKKTIPSSSQT